jgi:hypothetical protein
MSKTFRAWDVDQVWLLPASVHDFVPAGHPAHLVREVVRADWTFRRSWRPTPRNAASLPITRR